MIDLDDLKEKALAATPGPWFDDSYASPDDVSIWAGEDGDDASFLANIGGSRFREMGVAFDADGPNGRFISAANPATILDLIERLERAEHKLANAERLGKALFESKQYWADRALKAEAALQKREPVATVTGVTTRSNDGHTVDGYRIDIQWLGNQMLECGQMLYALPAIDPALFDTKLGAPQEPACPSSLHDFKAELDEFLADKLADPFRGRTVRINKATDAEIDELIAQVEASGKPAEEIDIEVRKVHMLARMGASIAKLRKLIGGAS